MILTSWWWGRKIFEVQYLILDSCRTFHNLNKPHALVPLLSLNIWKTLKTLQKNCNSLYGFHLVSSWKLKTLDIGCLGIWTITRLWRKNKTTRTEIRACKQKCCRIECLCDGVVLSETLWSWIISQSNLEATYFIGVGVANGESGRKVLPLR